VAHFARNLVGALILAGAFAGCGFSVGSPSAQVNYNYKVDCQSATSATTCTVHLSSDSSSTGTFNWKASSDDAGATFAPASGALAPGASADVDVTLPAGSCPKLTLNDAKQSITLVIDLKAHNLC